MMDTGIHENIPFAEYLAIDLPSSHFLRTLATNPARAHHERINPPPDTPALKFGRAAHAYCLDPAEWRNSYIAAGPGIDRRTKDGKESWAALCEEAAGREVVSYDDMERITAMRSALESHPAILRELAGSHEVTVIGEVSGVVVKTRPDVLRKRGPVIVDYKTAQSADRGEFQRAVDRFGYHVQAALYTDALAAVLGVNPRLVRFRFVVQEKTEPYSVAAYELGVDSVAIGREWYRAALETWQDCNLSGTWPGYPDEVQPLELPEWRLSNPNTPQPRADAAGF